jgi:hypothetical protein
VALPYDFVELARTQSFCERRSGFALGEKIIH